MANPYYIGWALMSAFAAVALLLSGATSSRTRRVWAKRTTGWPIWTLGVWVLISLWGLANVRMPTPWPDTVRSLLSTGNSMLYLLAIQHFDYAYEQVRRRWWRTAVLTSAAVTAAMTLLIAWYATANGASRQKRQTNG